MVFIVKDYSLFVCFVALRPISTAKAERSVNLTILFPGQD